MTRRPYSFFILLVGFTFLMACSSIEQHDTNTPEGAFKMALEYAKANRHEEAIAQLQQLKTKYPYSSFAPQAELKIADLHFERGSYIEAEANYQLFRELYPRHPRMDYVTYQIGMSFFNQLPSTTDRDLTPAYEAQSFFENLIGSYPSSQYVTEARERRQEVLEKLADKELYIAEFYRKREEFPSALGRYEGLLTRFPDSARVPDALYGAARSAARSDEPTKAQSYAETLMERFPQSDQAKKLQDEMPL